MINSLLQERAAASPLNIAHMNCPVATPKLVDDMFRSYQPGGTGLDFGRGLSPFSVICQGHEGIKEIEELTHKASLVESGTSTTLAIRTTRSPQRLELNAVARSVMNWLTTLVSTWIVCPRRM